MFRGALKHAAVHLNHITWLFYCFHVCMYMYFYTSSILTRLRHCRTFFKIVTHFSPSWPPFSFLMGPVNPRVESPGKNTVLPVLVCSWNQTKSFCYFRILMRNGFLTKLGKRQDSCYLTPKQISFGSEKKGYWFLSRKRQAFFFRNKISTYM